MTKKAIMVAMQIRSFIRIVIFTNGKGSPAQRRRDRLERCDMQNQLKPLPLIHGGKLPPFRELG